MKVRRIFIAVVAVSFVLLLLLTGFISTYFLKNTSTYENASKKVLFLEFVNHVDIQKVDSTLDPPPVTTKALLIDFPCYEISNGWLKSRECPLREPEDHLIAVIGLKEGNYTGDLLVFGSSWRIVRWIYQIPYNFTVSIGIFISTIINGTILKITDETARLQAGDGPQITLNAGQQFTVASYTKLYDSQGILYHMSITIILMNYGKLFYEGYSNK